MGGNAMNKPYFIDEEEDDYHFLDDPLFIIKTKPDSKGLAYHHRKPKKQKSEQ
jgi:hypothetical protein